VHRGSALISTNLLADEIARNRVGDEVGSSFGKDSGHDTDVTAGVLGRVLLSA
jgi:hypothetical protein